MQGCLILVSYLVAGYLAATMSPRVSVMRRERELPLENVCVHLGREA